MMRLIIGLARPPNAGGSSVFRMFGRWIDPCLMNQFLLKVESLDLLLHRGKLKAQKLELLIKTFKPIPFGSLRRSSFLHSKTAKWAERYSRNARERTAVSWSVVIDALVLFGEINAARELFWEMEKLSESAGIEEDEQ
ncbi:hypothetical protein NL676_039072 [Syzygium grande]|nr:hypothetical protein NL676_039072 [Syzygium grande]